MFTNFFYALKDAGLKVTMSEWLTLQDALKRGMAGSSLTQFYYLARMILVKSETDFDKFDMVFESCFKAAAMETAAGVLVLFLFQKQLCLSGGLI